MANSSVQLLAVLLMVSLLLLAGCAGTTADNGNGNQIGNITVNNAGNNGINAGNNINRGTSTAANQTAYLPGNGKAQVSVQDVTSGCGIEPPDGNYSECGAHSAKPHPGMLNASVYLVASGILSEPANFIVEADANGEFSLDMLPGNYMLELRNSEGNGIQSVQFTISEGKTTEVDMDFTYGVPQSKP